MNIRQKDAVLQAEIVNGLNVLMSYPLPSVEKWNDH
jgi:hypothetical protein